MTLLDEGLRYESGKKVRKSAPVIKVSSAIFEGSQIRQRRIAEILTHEDASRLDFTEPSVIQLIITAFGSSL